MTFLNAGCIHEVTQSLKSRKSLFRISEIYKLSSHVRSEGLNGGVSEHDVGVKANKPVLSNRGARCSELYPAAAPRTIRLAYAALRSLQLYLSSLSGIVSYDIEERLDARLVSCLSAVIAMQAKFSCITQEKSALIVLS